MSLKPAAIFFDWDGTLVDTYAFLEGAHNHTHEALGRPVLEDGIFKKYFGKPKHFIYSDLYGDVAPQAMELFKAYYLENHLSGIQVLAGAEDVLRRVSEVGIPMGVVTNKQADYVLAEINHLGWGAYFKSVVTAGEAAEDKPSGAPLELSIVKASIQMGNGDVWLVGDTENDVLCARNAGHKSILVEAGDAHDDLIAGYDVHMNFLNCQEFYDFLLQSPEKWIKR